MIDQQLTQFDILNNSDCPLSFEVGSFTSCDNHIPSSSTNCVKVHKRVNDLFTLLFTFAHMSIKIDNVTINPIPNVGGGGGGFCPPNFLDVITLVLKAVAAPWEIWS